MAIAIRDDQFDPVYPDLDVLFKSPQLIEGISNAAAGLSVGSVTNYSACPPGLEYLHTATALYLKPYSGPHVVGNITSKKTFEILNADAKRIFMLSVDANLHRSNLLLIRDEEDYNKKKYPVQMSVLNHYQDEVFHYFGTPGKLMKVSSDGSFIWGEAIRRWDTICGCPCSLNKRICYDAFIQNKPGQKDNHTKRDSDARRLSADVSAGYSIEGERQYSCFPSSSTKKMYFGTYDCKIKTLFIEGESVKESKSSIGRVSTNLQLDKLGIDLPGIIFPKHLDIYHKAVLFGTLLIDVIRN